MIEKSRNKSSIAYYITSHGYGHGVRSCGIIRSINAIYPDLGIEIATSLPPGFLDSHLGKHENSIRSASFDIGMCQIDSIRVDVPATLEKVRALYSLREEYVRREAAYLENQGIRMVVADIPAIPIEAASLVGIPSVAVGNFSWDWIYSEFLDQDSDWAPIVDAFKEGYSKTDLLLRLPFCDRMQAFPRIEDISLIASPGKARRDEIVDLTQCDPGRRWILLSFTTLEWGEEALRRVEDLTDYEFFTVDPLRWERRNIHPLDRHQMSFSDVLASMDAVISKPGFGILSDCVANQKPLIYADRSHFLEYPVLVAAIEKYIKYVHIPSADLYRGDLEESLHCIWERPDPREMLPLGGDRIAANRIAQFL